MKLSGTSICTYTIACITCALGACIHTLRTLHYTTLLQTTPDYITFIHTCELQTTIRVCFWGLRVCCAFMQKDVYNITSVSPCLPACLFMAIMDRFAVHILVYHSTRGVVIDSEKGPSWRNSSRSSRRACKWRREKVERTLSSSSSTPARTCSSAPASKFVVYGGVNFVLVLEEGWNNEVSANKFNNLYY